MITIIAKKDLIEDRYLRSADTTEVRSVVSAIKEKKTMLRTRGFSRDKELRALGDIPREIYYHPALRHVFHNRDPIEGEKLKKRFLNERNAFRLVEKI